MECKYQQSFILLHVQEDISAYKISQECLCDFSSTVVVQFATTCLGNVKLFLISGLALATSVAFIDSQFIHLTVIVLFLVHTER